MFQPKKIVLVIDNYPTDKDCQFGVNRLVNQGYRAEIFRISGFFTNDPVEDFYRFAADCRVSPQELDREFAKAKHPMTGSAEVTFEDFCWTYVSRVLYRAVGTLKDIGCVIGTDSQAVGYLVKHLEVEADVSGIVVPKYSEVQDFLDLEQKTTFL